MLSLANRRKTHKAVRLALGCCVSLWGSSCLAAGSSVVMADQAQSVIAGTSSAQAARSSTVPASAQNGKKTQNTAASAKESQAQQDQQDQQEPPAQQPTSLDSGQGIYFLPPLPGRPAYVRPGVDTAYQNMSPLSPKEIQWVKQQMAASQYAMHETHPLQIQNPILTVGVGPGSQVPVVHLARGYVTTLSVVDAEGNPWPITAYVVGGGEEAGAQMFAIQAAANSDPQQARQTTTKKGIHGVTQKQASLPVNLMTISPSFFGASSNLVLTLEGMSTPIMVDLRTGKPTGKTVDGMVTLRIDRMGPNAPMPIMQAPPPSPVDSSLLLFLAQTPPKGSVDLKASGGYGVLAWEWQGKTIVRSRVPLAMPAWTAEITQDGVRVYSLPETRQLLLRTANGMEPVRLVKVEDVWQNPDANYLLAGKIAPPAATPPPPVPEKKPRIVNLNLGVKGGTN